MKISRAGFFSKILARMKQKSSAHENKNQARMKNENQAHMKKIKRT